MIVDEDVYMAHYGKKGMKWGQRKSAAASLSTNAKTNGKDPYPGLSTKKAKSAGDKLPTSSGKGKSRDLSKLKEKQLQTAKRVAEGTGNKRDKAKVIVGANAIQLIMAKGSTKKVAQKQFSSLQGEKDRLASGKASSLDILRNAGTKSAIELGQGRKSKKGGR